MPSGEVHLQRIDEHAHSKGVIPEFSRDCDSQSSSTTTAVLASINILGHVSEMLEK